MISLWKFTDQCVKPFLFRSMIFNVFNCFFCSCVFFRSHLREIRDRSVLRLFESNEVVAPQAIPGGHGVPQPLQNAGFGHWDQDQVGFWFLFLHILIKMCSSVMSWRARWFSCYFLLLFHSQSYFSEPEFDTEYQHQHVHKNKVSWERKTLLLFTNGIER